MLDKLFGPLRERYANRPGGYTRVLLIEPLKEDQAPSAILELVDGPKDMRFAMTARTVAKIQNDGKEINEMTQRNIEKVTQFRKNGKKQLDAMVAHMRFLEVREAKNREERRERPIYKEAVYHATKDKLEKERKKNIKTKPNFFLI
jgi:large subunit ribosomal protein L17